MDPRRAAPVLVTAAVVGALVFFTIKHRDAKPLDDPEAAAAGGPGRDVDIYAASGKNKRLTGEDLPLPEGHPALPEGHPAVERPPTTGETPSPGAVPADDSDLPFTYAVPAGWTQEAPSDAMRKIQWALPAEPGGKPGVIYVTTGLAGGVAGNVARWAKQMGQAEAKTSELTVGPYQVTRVDVSGTFTGMGPAAKPEPDSRLLGAVFVLPPTSMFTVKAVGPAAVMAREEKAFDAFLASFKPR